MWGKLNTKNRAVMLHLQRMVTTWSNFGKNGNILERAHWCFTRLRKDKMLHKKRLNRLDFGLEEWEASWLKQDPEVLCLGGCKLCVRVCESPELGYTMLPISHRNSWLFFSWGCLVFGTLQRTIWSEYFWMYLKLFLIHFKKQLGEKLPLWNWECKCHCHAST